MLYENKWLAYCNENPFTLILAIVHGETWLRSEPMLYGEPTISTKPIVKGE